ncbi:hypothetical protein JL721_5559 [Aureococcus anophagefferens]|nr:hypothetical protein JL721_5559 [Aureococcus anophagefferens]
MPAPSTRMCHICGRQFGKNSIDIHIPQCLKKYEAAQAQLPPHERKPAPAAPQLLGAGASDRAYNDAAYEALEANMAECEFCGRTFAPDRLAIHNRAGRDVSPEASEPPPPTEPPPPDSARRAGASTRRATTHKSTPSRRARRSSRASSSPRSRSSGLRADLAALR